MFRQRRKHRFEQLEQVRERTEGMTVRDLESHLHFYRVLDKWTGDQPIASDFFSAWERVIKEAKQKVSKPKKPKLPKKQKTKKQKFQKIQKF